MGSSTGLPNTILKLALKTHVSGNHSVPGKLGQLASTGGELGRDDLHPHCSHAGAWKVMPKSLLDEVLNRCIGKHLQVRCISKGKAGIFNSLKIKQIFVLLKYRTQS